VRRIREREKEDKRREKGREEKGGKEKRGLKVREKVEKRLGSEQSGIY
jgi:hypothetical protein